MDEIRATLLRLHPLGENGVIAVWMTPAGIQKTAARGAMSPKSPFRGMLDLFFQCSIHWIPSRAGDLHTLASCRVLNPRLGLREHFSRLSAASYFVRLLLATIEAGTPAEAEDNLLERALLYLEKQNPDHRAILHFEKELATIHGIYAAGGMPHPLTEKQGGKLSALRKSLLDSLAH